MAQKTCPPWGSPDCPGDCDDCGRNPDLREKIAADRADYEIDRLKANELYE